MDSLYMAVTTLTTVGYGEVHPLSTAGRFFVMGYLVVCLGFFFYCTSQVAEMMVKAELSDWFGRRKMDARLKALNDHFIICGIGRMGLSVCQQLTESKMPFVVIDKDPHALAHCDLQGWPRIEGDATDDQTLVTAGIHRAKGLAAVLANDSDNLYVVMSARMIMPKLQIIARASEETHIPKLERAGANRVVSMFTAAGTKVAQLLVNPSLDDFVQMIGSEGRELTLAEIHVSAGTPYAGKLLQETSFRQRGVMVVGIRRANGQFLMPPAATERILVDDRLVVLGRSHTIAPPNVE